MLQPAITQFISTLKTEFASLPLSYWVGLALALLFLGAKYLSPVSKRSLPPGPRGLPFLGNVFQVHNLQWLRFTQWKDEFGPVFSLNLAGQPVIVLNSRKATADLLDRRSQIYSDRPRFIMAGDILTGGMFLALLGYGELWRKLRRASHEGLNVRAVERYQPRQEKEAAVLVTDMLQEPTHWEELFKRSAVSTVGSAIYAWPPIGSKHNDLVTRVEEFIYRLARAALPGAYLVEIFPAMRWLPSWVAAWKRDGLEWYRKDDEMFQGLIEGVREQVHAGSYQPSFAACLIEFEKGDGLELTKKESAWLAGTMIGAGSETTATSLSWFILAMTLYPDVMRKAQVEVDTVVGRERVPTFADGPRLPYIRAVVKEVLRWRPTAPIVVAPFQGDLYDGYYIPKGTIVIANIWAMNRDPEIFPDYDEFRPERFLNSSGEIDIAAPDTHGQGHVTFGFGKRICPGMHIANQALFINIATILWAMDIEKAVNAQGVAIIPSSTDCIDKGVVVRPAPFKCNITARSTDVAPALEMAKA